MNQTAPNLITCTTWWGRGVLLNLPLRLRFTRQCSRGHYFSVLDLRVRLYALLFRLSACGFIIVSVCHPRNTESTDFLLGAPASKGSSKHVCLLGDPSSHILTRRDLLSLMLSFSHLVRGGSWIGTAACTRRRATRKAAGVRPPSHRLAPTRKKAFKSARRVEMLLAAVQVWTRERG